MSNKYLLGQKNDEIETMLLSTKEKIVDVTAKLSENASIETATPLEEEPEARVAVTAPTAPKPDAKLVVTNAKEMLMQCMLLQ